MTPTDEDMKVARDVCKELAPFLRFAHCWLWLDPAAEEVIARALASQRASDAEILESYLRCNPDPHRFVIKQLAAAIRAGKKG